jgi:hypothetical protein
MVVRDPSARAVALRGSTLRAERLRVTDYYGRTQAQSGQKHLGLHSGAIDLSYIADHLHVEYFSICSEK